MIKHSKLHIFSYWTVDISYWVDFHWAKNFLLGRNSTLIGPKIFCSGPIISYWANMHLVGYKIDIGLMNWAENFVLGRSYLIGSIST